MATTTLNSAWFTANPGPPWVLVGDNTTFVLAVDVDVPSALSSGVPNSGAKYGGGELFKFSGKNQSFNASGHHIRFNGQDIRQRTRPHSTLSESEVPATGVDNVGGRSGWEKPQDTGQRHGSDTGGHAANIETTTGQKHAETHGGTTQTGRGGRL
jgi:hypothetical protein